MTAALVAVGVGVALLVVAIASVVIARRASRRTEDRIAAALAQLDARVGELSVALEDAREESRRTRELGELGSSIDLDEVLANTLEAAVALPGADAALISLPRGVENRPLVATLGLSAEEAEREGVVTGPPDGRAAVAISTAYRYSEEELVRNGGLIRAGLAVPLPLDGQHVGHLAIFTRSDQPFAEGDIAQLDSLAVRAGPAIENARRFREARHLADLDALTGLHNRRYFYETLAREIARAHRYRRNLSLIVFDVDDFKAINDRVGHLAGDSVLADAAEKLRAAARSADVACRVGGDEFAVILAESTAADAEQLYERIRASLASRSVGETGATSFSAGAAELRSGENSSAFFQRADDALYRAKEAGKARLVIADG